jgi:ectoine hydroxylase
MPRMRALSVSISLTENFDNNGPLMLIPESHKQYVVCEGETPENNYLASLKKQKNGVPSDACLKNLVTQGGMLGSYFVSRTPNAESMDVLASNALPS